MPRRDLELGVDLDLWSAQAQTEAQYQVLLGCDEAGRGPLAGPVVCAAVQLNPGTLWPELRDSKKISAKTRDLLFDRILQEAQHYAIEVISASEIDSTDILSASLEGMTRCAERINKDATVVVDGSQLLRRWKSNQFSLVKGDDRLACIAAASILAKVTRDRWMEQAEKDYPGYGFAKHKGYPTAMHLQALNSLGPCPIHRMSFKPLSQLDLFRNI